MWIKRGYAVRIKHIISTSEDVQYKSGASSVQARICSTNQAHHYSTPLQWFHSYLSNRKQYVSVNGLSSDELIITNGVPQGSVLGPPLFLIFINDSPNISKHLTIYLFADDTNIYYESSNLLHTQKIVNRELRKVREWLEANRLALNIGKQILLFFIHSNVK